MSTDAKRQGNARHLEKLERITFWLHKDGSDEITKDQIRHAAEQCGQSVNAWILDAIRDKI